MKTLLDITFIVCLIVLTFFTVKQTIEGPPDYSQQLVNNSATIEQLLKDNQQLKEDNRQLRADFDECKGN